MISFSRLCKVSCDLHDRICLFTIMLFILLVYIFFFTCIYTYICGHKIVTVHIYIYIHIIIYIYIIYTCAYMTVYVCAMYVYIYTYIHVHDVILDYIRMIISTVCVYTRISIYAHIYLHQYIDHEINSCVGFYHLTHVFHHVSLFKVYLLLKNILELDELTIYRTPPITPGKNRGSYRFSMEPIHS